jgi:hypothetical protein
MCTTQKDIVGLASLVFCRWLRWRGAKTSVELTGVLAIAYLAYYVAQSPSMVGCAALIFPRTMLQHVYRNGKDAAGCKDVACLCIWHEAGV